MRSNICWTFKDLLFLTLQNITSWSRSITRGWGGLQPPLATNQAKIPYPKPLKHSNKTKIRLHEGTNNSSLSLKLILV